MIKDKLQIQINKKVNNSKINIFLIMFFKKITLKKTLNQAI